MRNRKFGETSAGLQAPSMAEAKLSPCSTSFSYSARSRSISSSASRASISSPQEARDDLFGGLPGGKRI